MSTVRHASSTRADERRHALIEAAYRIIAEQGLKGLRTRAVAAQVGLTHATLHYYFPTKEALIQAVIDYAVFQRLLAGIPLFIDERAGTPLEQLRGLLTALEFYKRIPGTQVVYHRKGEYAILAIGKGQLGLVSRPVPTHVEIDAPDPDALYAQLKQAGLPVTEPPEAKGWGDYTFVMYDPDGNCLEFCRPRNTSAGSWA